METNNPTTPAAAVAAPAAAPAAGQDRGGRGGNRPGGNRPGGNRPGGRGDSRGPRRGSRPEADKEFDQRNLALDRVTRVTKGGKRMRFRACVIIGDHKGRVGFGVAKAGDVSAAINKAVTQAKKKVFTVPMAKETIPHQVDYKFGAAKVLLKPAPAGTGVKAGGAMRVVLEMAGVPNVVGKILGTNNKINNTKATVAALKLLRLRAA
jgi:small subunit ribosomal protein S5